MRIRTWLPALAALSLAVAAFPGAAGAVIVDNPVPDRPDADVCEPFGDAGRLVCLEIQPGDPENLVAPAASACVYDEAVHTVLWWYGSGGMLACASTHHWAWLGTPGACFGTGATGDPTVCAGKDEPRYGPDGRRTGTKHCLVWVAGSSFCFLD